MMPSVPIRDSGMAMTGINTERGDPRKAKITSMTMISASTSVTATSWIEAFTKSVESYMMLRFEAARQLGVDVGKRRRARP